MKTIIRKSALQYAEEAFRDAVQSGIADMIDRAYKDLKAEQKKADKRKIR